jgi:hypothetical protein
MSDDRPNRLESLVERLIRDAEEAGEFVDLPGAGKPIPGAGRPDSEGWWIAEWVRRNRDEQEEG